MKYKLCRYHSPLSVINNLEEAANFDFVESDGCFYDQMMYDDDFFKDNCLLVINHQDSQTIFSYKLLEIVRIDEMEDVIKVVVRYRPMPSFRDLRIVSIFIPYKKTKKKVELEWLTK